MSETAIFVEGLSKRYLLDHEQTGGQTTLRDALSSTAKNLAGQFSGRTARSKPEEFWALQDVSFEVKVGDRIGVLGRNGAGKSTLLKILSRITEPTRGRVRMNGRVASLLEVGTGFHPELSGRENIYLNGAILGMAKSETRGKFDEIVAFAEVEKFLDTPVKRYSSGMYVRLAFAVAAHLEPEILIVDEVLAVGDGEFQKKCLGKMQEVSGSGRTVLFVSHNMAAITALCDKALWLTGGQVKMQGEAEAVASAYLMSGAETSGEAIIPDKGAGNAFKFRRLTLLNEAGKVTSILDVRQPFRVQIEYTSAEMSRELEISLRVCNAYGVPIFTTLRSQSLPGGIATGTQVSEVFIPAHFLTPGSYSLSIAAFNINIGVVSHLQDLLTFEIEETGSSMALYKGHSYGAVLVDFSWQDLNNAALKVL